MMNKELHRAEYFGIRERGPECVVPLTSQRFANYYSVNYLLMNGDAADTLNQKCVRTTVDLFPMLRVHYSFVVLLLLLLDVVERDLATLGTMFKALHVM